MAEMTERDVFISHEKTDGDVALELAARLRAAGFSTWCYEEDSTAGGSYLVQIDRAIEAARSMVVIISPHSIRSPHVRNEVVRAYESQKRFIPIRRGMAHEDVLKAQDEADDDRRREWRMAFGAAVSVPWDAADPAGVANKVADGLRRVGVSPTGEFAVPRIAVSSDPAPFDARQAGANFVADLGLPSDPRVFRSALEKPIARVIVAGFVAGLGVLGNFQTILGTIAPGPADFVYSLIPFTRLVNFATAAAGLWLSVKLARATWVLFQGDESAKIEVRRVTSLELLLIGSWFAVMVLFVLFGVPKGAETMRGPMFGGAIKAGLWAGIPVGICRQLFKRPAALTPSPLSEEKV